MEDLKERYIRCVLGSQDVLGTQAAKDICFKSVFESRGIFTQAHTKGEPSPRGSTAPVSVKASSAAARQTPSVPVRSSTKTGSQKAVSRPQLQSPEILL